MREGLRVCMHAERESVFLNPSPFKHPPFSPLFSVFLSPPLSLSPAGILVLPSVPHDHKFFINEWFWKRAASESQ